MDRTERFRSARRDPALAVLEGFHALKHAIRFGAEILEAAAAESAAIDELAASLAPDLAGRLDALIARIPDEELSRLSPAPLPTGIIALARRPVPGPEEMLRAPSRPPVVLLEGPRRLENVGAAVRVAAAAGAAGVLTTGDADPWHPRALRAAAGLHFALPIDRVDALPPSDRPLVGLDPEGDPLPTAIPERAVLAFGAERQGLSTDLRQASEMLVRIPMREGVSSLNLATAVAAVLYMVRSTG